MGVRRTPYTRRTLERGWATVQVLGCDVAVKVGHSDGVVLQVMPEFEDVARAARALGRSEREVLGLAHVAAAQVNATSRAPSPLRPEL